MVLRPPRKRNARLERVQRQAALVDFGSALRREQGGGDETAGCLMTGFQPSVVLRIKGKNDAGEAGRTVSATQTVSERSLRRAETSVAMLRTAGGGKAEAIVGTRLTRGRIKG